MARSYRRTPIVSYTTARTDKPGKQQANRTLRAAARHALANCRDYEELTMPALREVSNVWSFPKDGKHYIHRRFRDASWYAKVLRK